MKLTVHPEHLRTYRDVVAVLIKYGGSDFVRSVGLDADLGEAGETSKVRANADELASDLEKMGPTFIKLGQLFSTRFDIVPAVYARALSRLQDRVAPFPIEEAEAIVADELGRPVSEIFQTFDAPMAAASIGQVHRATLLDGRVVAVKVQRPEVSRHVSKELDSLSNMAELLEEHTEFGRRFQLGRILTEFSRAIRRELDYRIEARNQSLLAGHMSAFPHIIVPRPVKELTTSKVLTMDFIDGAKLEAMAELELSELELKALADEVFSAYLQQILVDGFFHADPHPGNVLVTADGRVALIDLGMVGRLTNDVQERVLQLLLAIADGKGDLGASVALSLGRPGENFDEEGFRRDVSEVVSMQHGLSVEEMEVGALVLEITRLCAQHGVHVPSELMLLGKTLLNLDQVGRALFPGFDPNASMKRHSSRILQQRLMQSVSPAAILGGAIEVKGLVEKLPARLNRILELVATNQIQVKVQSPDTEPVLERLEKIGNRLTMSVVLAALIVGAAMLFRLETSFQILGYPGFAVFFFFLAAAGGVALLASTILAGRNR